MLPEPLRHLVVQAGPVFSMIKVQDAAEDSDSKDKSASDRLDRFLKFSFSLAMLTIFILVTCANVAEPDIWGHMRLGEDILRLGRVPTADPYSYVNQGFSCIDHEWLFEVIMASCYNLGGNLGIVLFKGALVLGIVCLMVLPLRQVRFGLFSGAFIILIALQIMGPGIVVIRPHLVTYLLFAAVCLVLRQATLNSSKWLWFLPLIMILWANCHGGFLSGLAVFLLWAIIQTLVLWKAGNRLEDIRRIWLIAIVTFAAQFINPFGFRLVEFLLPVMKGMQLDIGEWNPLVIYSESGLYYLATCAVLILSLFFTDQKRRPSFVIIVCLMMTAPLVAKRHLALFVIAVIFFAAEHLESLLRQTAKKIGATSFAEFSWHSKLIMTLVSLVTAGDVVFQLSKSFGRIVPMEGVPVAAVNLLDELKAEGNMVCFFDWGEYIIWHLGPRVKVSIDGRRETTYPIKVYLQNIEFTRGLHAWDAILDDYPSNLVLICKEQPSFNLMKYKPGWTLAYEDNGSALFVRNGSPLIARIQARLKSGKPIVLSESGFP
jgi:hypothetical protein